MVVRTRLRAVLFPLSLYAFSGAVSSYFVWHAVNGERGLKATVSAKARLRDLQTELSAIQTQTGKMRVKVAAMQPDAIDRDLLEEQARLTLGRIGRNEWIMPIATP